jgi:hypothetical protein
MGSSNEVGRKNKMVGNSISAPGIRPIRERFLNTTNMFALLFEEGLVYGHVIQREILKFKPLHLEDESGAAVSIAARAAGSDITIRDPRQTSQNMLGGTNMRAKWGEFPQILHGAIGFGPYNFRAYVRYPDKSGANMGLWPTTGSPVVSNGDKLANIDSDDSPYHEPTDAAEMVVVPGKDISIQFFNVRSSGADFSQTPDSQQPILNLSFARYKFEILKPGDVRSNILIRKMMYGEMEGNFRILPVGFGENLIKFDSTDLSLRWGSKENPLSPVTWEQAISLPDLRNRR